MDRLDYTKQDYNAEQACVGLIVLQTDEVVESEVRRWLPNNITLYHTRIPNQDAVNKETLLEMGKQIPQVCALFPKHAPIKVVAYCCTSGATIIGEAAVERGVQQIFPDARVTNPITAVKARLNYLGAHKIGLLTPYIPSVTQAMSEHLIEHGYVINNAASFYEQNDFEVCRISANSIIHAIEHVASQGDCDAIFASCTNLRTISFIETLSEKIGIPVISSNAALAWHIAELSTVA